MQYIIDFFFKYFHWGKGATGILTQLALKKGHASVKDYLESLVKKHGNDNFDDDED